MIEHPHVAKIREHPDLAKHNENPEFAANYWKGAQNMIAAARLEKGSTIAIVVDKPRSAMGKALKAAAEEVGMKVRLFSSHHEEVIHGEHEFLTSILPKLQKFKPKVTYLCVGDEELENGKAGFSAQARGRIYQATSNVPDNRFIFTCPTIEHEHVAEILSKNIIPVQELTRAVGKHIIDAHEGGGVVRLLTGDEGDFSCKMSNITLDDMAPPLHPFQGLMIANQPGGEVECDDPLEVSGTVEFTKGSQLGRFGKISKKVTAKFKEGYLEELIAHSDEDQLLVDQLNEYMQKNTNKVMEFAVGTNPNIPEHLQDNPLVMEKILGTIHIGIGNDDEHHDLIAIVKKLTIGEDEYIDNGEWTHEGTQDLLEKALA